MAHQDIAKQKPIGYWLKHADNVITEHIDRVLSENDFTRSRWQAHIATQEADDPGSHLAGASTSATRSTAP